MQQNLLFLPPRPRLASKKSGDGGTLLQRFCRIPMQIQTFILLRIIQLAMHSAHLIKDHLQNINLHREPTMLHSHRFSFSTFQSKSDVDFNTGTVNLFCHLFSPTQIDNKTATSSTFQLWDVVMMGSSGYLVFPSHRPSSAIAERVSKFCSAVIKLSTLYSSTINQWPKVQIIILNFIFDEETPSIPVLHLHYQTIVL